MQDRQYIPPKLLMNGDSFTKKFSSSNQSIFKLILTKVMKKIYQQSIDEIDEQ